MDTCAQVLKMKIFLFNLVTDILTRINILEIKLVNNRHPRLLRYLYYSVGKIERYIDEDHLD